jgi:hypothetical protein
MLCSLAKLSEENLSAIKDYEEKTGRVILAYSCRDVGIDKMSDEELHELRKLEDRLCLQLVAVK